MSANASFNKSILESVKDLDDEESESAHHHEKHNSVRKSQSDSDNSPNEVRKSITHKACTNEVKRLVA